MTNFPLAGVDWPWRWLSGPDHAQGEGLETTFEHTWNAPSWLTLLAVLLILGVIMSIYIRERAALRWRRAILVGLRLSALALVFVMLCGWVRHRHRTELPDLLVIVDSSESMSFADVYQDARLRQAAHQLGGQNNGRTPSRLQLAMALLTDQRVNWLQTLKQDYRIKLFRIGQSPRRIELDASDQQPSAMTELAATDNTSRLGQNLLEILQSQRGRSTAAAIILTDGNTTAGPRLSEAAAYADSKSIPLFFVGLGSEQPPQDIRLSDLLVNEVAFIGDVLNFDVQLHSQGFAGREVTARLLRADTPTVLAERVIQLPEDNAALPIRLTHRPEEEGDFEFAIEVETLPQEVNRDNNRLVHPVSVRDASIRVLLIQGAPSYEYRFLKSLLSRSLHRGRDGTRAIELTTVLQEADVAYAAQDDTAARVLPVQREELFTYDVVILGDCNPAFFGRSVLENLAAFVTERGGGLMMLAGPDSMPLQFRDTPLAELFPFELSTARLPAAQELVDESFHARPTALGLESPALQLGDSLEQTEHIWSQLPALRWFLEITDVNTGAIILAEHPQRRNLGGDKLPLILLQFVGAGKVVFHATDETYRWSRYEGDDRYYSRYWLQMLRYLSRSALLTDELPTTIATDARKYQHGDRVRLRVQFRDEKLAPAEADGCVAQLQDEHGKRKQVTLSRAGGDRGTFESELTDLPVGTYRVWLAAPALERQPPPHQFTIDSPLSEFSRLEMQAAELREAAQASDGGFYTLRGASRLPGDLPQGDQVRIEPLPPEPIWNSSWLAGLFVLLITAEWILRRRSGLL